MRQKWDVHEQDLYSLWEHFCWTDSRTRDLRLKGIFPGRLNTKDGPDFEGAEFELDGKIYCGDVEIHCQSKDWYHHRHHLDRRYDGVLLHLVWNLDEDTIVLNSMGREITTIALKNFPDMPKKNPTAGYCPLAGKITSDITAIIEDLALKRLDQKISNIDKMASSVSYDQILYSLILKVLGYANNTKNFENLSLLFTWDHLIQIKKNHVKTKDFWIALFLYKSAISYHNTDLHYLEKYSAQVKALSGASCLSPSLWNRAGQRPGNHPLRQIKALGMWIHEFNHSSLYQVLNTLLMSRLSYQQLMKALILFFQHPFITNNQQNPNPKTLNTHLNWGKGKIIEIIGNALIPFFLWEAEHNQSYGFWEYIKGFYLFLPQIHSYTKLKFYYQKSKILTQMSDQYYVNQALLLLSQQFCNERDCVKSCVIDSLKQIDNKIKNI
jgi:hypothetical protein